jgi:hypothetical protein
MISCEGSRLGEQAARRLAQMRRREIRPGLTDAEELEPVSDPRDPVQ